MILLDTHTWLWWLGASQKLSRAARESIEQDLGIAKICVSSISAWELAILVKKGRLALSMPVEDWVARSEALPFLHFVPVDNHIAIRSQHLNGRLPNDPADRIIVATAISLGATLVSKDEKLRAYPGVDSVW